MSEAAYRVEVASSARAVCKDSLCKSNGVKIKKGELRFATWVSSSNDQWSGFQYKHWGCVSGKILENIRNILLREDLEGEYQWDYLDGLSDLNEEFQNKVKTAIIEGKIADEDFNGDPAYNQLGKKGIRGRASTQKPAETEEANVNTTLDDSGTPAKSSAKKRRRTKKAEDDSAEEDDIKPTKNSRAKKRINKGGDATEEDEEKAETDAEPPKKAKSKKSVKANIEGTSVKEDNDFDVAKPRKLRSNEKDPDVRPTKRRRGKAAAAKE